MINTQQYYVLLLTPYPYTLAVSGPSFNIGKCGGSESNLNFLRNSGKYKWASWVPTQRGLLMTTTIPDHKHSSLGRSVIHVLIYEFNGYQKSTKLEEKRRFIWPCH